MKRLAKPSDAHFRHSRGFTLIEIMVAIGIMAVVLAMSMPAIYGNLKQEGIRKACADVMEGCTQARARAILNGKPFDLVIRSEDGSIQIEESRIRQDSGASDGSPISSLGSSDSRQPAFHGAIPDSVAVQMLDVNFRDHMTEDQARVRFFPNGTSDEFTIVLRDDSGGIRKISLEVVTALPSLEVLR